MKTLATTLTERGQISIPAKIRKDLRLKPGDRLAWREISEHECRLTVLARPAGPGAEAMLGYAKQFRQPRPTAEWMAELRDGETEDR